MKILLVDDSPLIINRLVDLLQELEKVDVLMHAGDYEQALMKLDQEQPDIILLDIQLPGRSGIELLKTIKEKYPSLIVLMLTNQATDNYKFLCKKLGADYFLDKSTDFELVTSIVSTYL